MNDMETAPPGGRVVTKGDISSWRVLALLALLLAVPTFALFAVNGDTTSALKLLGISAIVGSLYVFLHHGGSTLTAVGIYVLCLGLMVGSSSYYWSEHVPPGTSSGSVLLVSSAICATTAMTYALCWGRECRRADFRAQGTFTPISRHDARYVQAVGVLLFLAGVFLTVTGVNIGSLSRTCAEVGVILLGSALLLSGRDRLGRSPIRTAALLGVLVVFYLVMFEGGGRMRLATMMLTIIVVTQGYVRTRFKSLAVIAIVPTLLLFAAIGQSRLVEQTGRPSAQAAASGLGSLVNPVATFGELVDRKVTADPPGSTFVAEAVVLVPRQVWREKPEQFGAVVTSEIRPEAKSVGLSKPCLAQCEWYYNFSWWGLILAIPGLGLLLLVLDRKFAQLQRDRSARRHSLLLLLFVGMLVGSATDLAWGGTATWVARNAQRFLVLLPFIAWAWITTSTNLHRTANSAGPAKVSGRRLDDEARKVATRETSRGTERSRI